MVRLAHSAGLRSRLRHVSGAPSVAYSVPGWSPIQVGQDFVKVWLLLRGCVPIQFVLTLTQVSESLMETIRVQNPKSLKTVKRKKKGGGGEDSSHNEFMTSVVVLSGDPVARLTPRLLSFFEVLAFFEHLFDWHLFQISTSDFHY